MIDIVQKLMDEFNHHSGELAELLEGAASEIDLLRDEKADLSERVDKLASEAYTNGELYNKEHLLRIRKEQELYEVVAELDELRAVIQKLEDDIRDLSIL
jgi:uncharacterized coiled-coil DUF342 family protein